MLFCDALDFCAELPKFLVDALSFSKVQGRPFLVSEIERKIEEMLRGASGPPAQVPGAEFSRSRLREIAMRARGDRTTRVS